MSTADSEEAPLLAAAKPPKVRRRPPAQDTTDAGDAQYAIIATLVGLSVAATLHYLVTPHVVAQFEAIDAAFKRLPRRWPRNTQPLARPGGSDSRPVIGAQR